MDKLIDLLLLVKTRLEVLNWTQITIQGLITIGATFLAVYFAYHKENIRKRREEENLFQRLLPALILECGNNIAKANVLQKNISERQFNLSKLHYYVPKKIISESYSYKYFNQDFFYNVYMYIEQIHLLNERLSFMYSEFIKTEGKNLPINVKQIQEELEKFIKITMLLEIQTQIYVNIFNVKLGPIFQDRPFLENLKKLNTLEADDLHKELEEAGKMKKEDIDKLHANFKKAFDDTHAK